jgi:two-component sensor histidine kinase
MRTEVRSNHPTRSGMYKIVRSTSATSGIAIRTKPRRTLSFIFWPKRTIVKHEPTKHIVPLPNPDGSLLLRELDHRIKGELTSVIYAVSAKAVQSDSVAVKAALLDVADLLHQWGDVHRALHMPEQGHLTDAATYLQRLCLAITKHRLDRLAIRVLFSADDLQLEGERCWKLGLIVSELLTNVARHAQFDARDPELRVELMHVGDVVKCRVSDNGAAPEPVRRGRGLAIIDELVDSLGGRVHSSYAAEGYSFLLTFPLTEAEQRADGAARVVLLKRRKRRRPPAVAGVRIDQPRTVTGGKRR